MTLQFAESGDAARTQEECGHVARCRRSAADGPLPLQATSLAGVFTALLGVVAVAIACYAPQGLEVPGDQHWVGDLARRGGHRDLRDRRADRRVVGEGDLDPAVPPESDIRGEKSLNPLSERAVECSGLPHRGCVPVEGASEQLRDIEEIRQVKHRYLRCVDLKLWDEICDALTENAALDTGTSAFGKLVEIFGRHEIAAFFRAKLGPAMLTGHTASQPEITVDGDKATGVWSYRETVLATKHRMVIASVGFCEERYERGTDARWRIARTRYVRNYEVMVSLDDLPSFKIIAALGGEVPGGEPPGNAHAHAGVSANLASRQ